MQFFRFVKYRLFRPLISYFAWHFYYTFYYKKIKETKSGEPLKKGISAIVPLYNEEYHLPIVLESIIGIAEQVIILNNGSTDNSLQIASQFEKKYSGVCLIEIVNLPDRSLVDVLNEGLQRVKHEWLLRWDGDFVNYDKSRFQKLKSNLEKRKRPAAFRLPYINLCGDYAHAFKPTGALCTGEFYLRSFNKNLDYELINGRLEVCIIPLYYRLQEEEQPYIIHLGHVKPVARIMHRHIYMDWIDTLNNFPALKSRYASIDSFRNDWIKKVLQADNFLSAKFRFSRLLAIQCESTDDSLRKSFPGLLNDFIKNHAKRYSVVYENGKPYRITDAMDSDSINYFPTNDDLAWQPGYIKFYTRNSRLQFVSDQLKK